MKIARTLLVLAIAVHGAWLTWPVLTPVLGGAASAAAPWVGAVLLCLFGVIIVAAFPRRGRRRVSRGYAG